MDQEHTEHCEDPGVDGLAIHYHKLEMNGEVVPGIEALSFSQSVKEGGCMRTTIDFTHDVRSMQMTKLMLDHEVVHAKLSLKNEHDGEILVVFDGPVGVDSVHSEPMAPMEVVRQTVTLIA